MKPDAGELLAFIEAWRSASVEMRTASEAERGGQEPFFAALRALVAAQDRVDGLLAAIWLCRENGTLPIGIGVAYDALAGGDDAAKKERA